MEENLTTNDAASWVDRVSFTQLPPSFNNLNSPWRVSKRVNNYKTINKLLAHSFVVQSSTIPTASNHNLRHFILSNGCLKICSLLKYYLSYLNVEAKAYCGILGPGIMHVFLEIGNEIVDNTYAHIQTGASAQENLTNYLKIFVPMKFPVSYDKRPPSETTVQFDEDGPDEHERRFAEITCKSDLNMRKDAASAIRKTDLGFGTMVYDKGSLQKKGKGFNKYRNFFEEGFSKLMRHWIKTELGVEIPCVTEVMDQVCWCCGKGNEELKRCAKCHIAKYCNTECQRIDWRAGHKLMHEIFERGNSGTLTNLASL